MMNRIAYRLTLPLLSLLLLATAGTGCAPASDRQVIGQANQVHGELRPAVITDSTLNDYLDRLEARIIEAARQLKDVPEAHERERAEWMFSERMKFHFVNSKTINAFTTGGEHMYIYTGLLLKCDTEDELAAVLCHEYAHVFARHVQQGMGRQKGLIGAAVVGAAAGAAAGAGDGSDKALEYGGIGAALGLAAGQFVGMDFTREDEDEADKLGFRIYRRAGWDPKLFADFFKKMIAMGFDTTPERMSDHPPLRSRVEATNQRIKDLGPDADKFQREPVATPREFEHIKARAAQLARDMPEDRSLEQAQTLLSAFSSCVSPVDQPDQVAAEQRLARQAQEKQARQANR